MTDEMRPVRELLDEPYFKIVASRFWVLLDDGGSAAELMGSSLNWGSLCRERWGEDYAEVLEVPCTQWGDYGGDCVQRSNFRVLVEEYPDTFLEIGYSSHDGQALYLPVDVEIPEELYDRLVGLGDYPLLDESDHSELEREIEQEDWDCYGRDDLRRAIERGLDDAQLPDHDRDEIDLSDDVLNECAWDAYSDGSLTWECESATSGFFRGLDELAERFVATTLENIRASYDEYARELMRQPENQLTLI